MPALLDTNSLIQCAHGLPARHAPAQLRVTILGAPVLTLADLGTVAGCPFTLPPPKPSPCVTVQWLQGAARVSIMGTPVLLATSSGLCKSPEQAPQGSPIIGAVQPRVSGS